MDKNIPTKNQYAKELTYAEKICIKRWYKEGKRIKEIAKLLATSSPRISYVLKTFKTEVNSNRVTKCGRKRIISKEVEKKLLEKLQQNRFLSAKKLSSIAKNENNIIISRSTVSRMINRHGFKACSPRKVPLISTKNKNIRLSMAKDFILTPLTLWKRVIWSDETKINIFKSDGKTWVWRLPGESYSENCTLKTVKHGGGSIMLWGCIGSNGVGNLVEIDGILTGIKYIKILQENLWTSAEKLGLGTNFVFQQDNDPKHRSRIVMNFFERNNVELLPWPSQSPDLNIIEHMWAEVKRRYGNYQAKNKQELIDIIQKIWRELGENYVQKIFKGLYNRFHEVIKNNGGATRY